MKTGKILLVTFIFSSLSFIAKAQVDSTFRYLIKLDSVAIVQNRLKEYAVGSKVIKIDSNQLKRYQNQNLSTLLANESSINIKSYGQGSLASTSFRGGSSNHTAVLWNGFNLNSSMNGMIDLSLVPIQSANEIAIQYGGSSALWGSGAIGGAILLNNQPTFNKGITSCYGYSFGSFGFQQHDIKATTSGKAHTISVNYFNTQSINDFSFKSPNDQEKRQTNAELKSENIIVNTGFKIKKKQNLSFNFWLQETERNLPPTLTQLVSKANQLDDALRLTGEWQLKLNNNLIQVRSAFFNESIAYNDPIAAIASKNNINTLISEAESSIKLHKNSALNIGLNNTNLMADATNFEELKTQNRSALFSSYKFTKKKLKASLSLRQELVDKSLAPFTYTFGGSYSIQKNLSLDGSIGKVYRLPNFNDLYWNPGGNENLLAENGYTQEISINYKKLLANKVIFKVTGTVFNKNIDNWIIWLPSGNVWSPHNVMNVWSRGTETHTSLKYNIKNWSFSWNIATNYVLSTNQKTISENDESLGKQLIYTPIYSGNTELNISYKKIQISYIQSYTGYTYTSTDHSNYLSPYHIANIFIAYDNQYKSFKLNSFLQINNIWNNEYQVIQNRAMPGINFNLGTTITFNSIKQ